MYITLRPTIRQTYKHGFLWGKYPTVDWTNNYQNCDFLKDIQIQHHQEWTLEMLRFSFNPNHSTTPIVRPPWIPNSAVERYYMWWKNNGLFTRHFRPPIFTSWQLGAVTSKRLELWSWKLDNYVDKDTALRQNDSNNMAISVIFHVSIFFLIQLSEKNPLASRRIRRLVYYYY